jgi:hypothetical protein
LAGVLPHAGSRRCRNEVCSRTPSIASHFRIWLPSPKKVSEGELLRFDKNVMPRRTSATGAGTVLAALALQEFETFDTRSGQDECTHSDRRKTSSWSRSSRWRSPPRASGYCCRTIRPRTPRSSAVQFIAWTEGVSPAHDSLRDKSKPRCGSRRLLGSLASGGRPQRTRIFLPQRCI